MTDHIRILIDFGSTFTKVVAVDLRGPEIVGQTRVPSTVGTDITIGLREALDSLQCTAGISNIPKEHMIACSSAAGGLRMVCVGFVPEYTSQAANLAALGAGAKVVGRFSYELDDSEVAEIESIGPDILLLTGGTDGGNKQTIIHNAQRLAQTGDRVPNIIVAGNKAALREIREIFLGSPKHLVFTRNVMPEIGQLDLAPSNHEIRELFMRRIIETKGIARAREIIYDVIMPTPSAVLEAARLISTGSEDCPGLGELLVVDTGGSTTNVHSIAAGHPRRPDIVTTGLPEPFEKRTVEGDIGLKYNLDTIVGLLSRDKPTDHLSHCVECFKAGILPRTEEEIDCHRMLAYLAVKTAVTRHAGRIEVLYGPTGQVFLQRGKDLTGIRTLIGTGGALAFSSESTQLMEAALHDQKDPGSLKPKAPRFYVDERYILYAVGLLGQSERRKALALAQRYLREIPSPIGNEVC